MNAEAIIRGLGLWQGEPEIEAVPAGYTNENFRVVAGGRAYFARVGGDLPHHGISRRNEAACARLAAEAGIAPEVIHAGEGVLVTPFVEGAMLKVGEPPGRATLDAVGELLSRVHRIPPPADLEEVDLVATCRRYLDGLGAASLAAEDWGRIEEILEAAPRLSGRCFVHGDAFPENFIDDGRRLWLVDWEYAGWGHPAADLAYVARNLDLPKGRLRELVEVYEGDVELATVSALLPVAAVRDALWCLTEIEARGSTEELDRYTRFCCDRLGLCWSG